MYVCVCNGITEKQVKKAIRNGAESVQDLAESLGLATGCGSCSSFANELIERNLIVDQPVTLLLDATPRSSHLQA